MGQKRQSSQDALARGRCSRVLVLSCVLQHSAGALRREVGRGGRGAEAPPLACSVTLQLHLVGLRTGSFQQ